MYNDKCTQDHGKFNEYNEKCTEYNDLCTAYNDKLTEYNDKCTNQYGNKHLKTVMAFHSYKSAEGLGFESYGVLSKDFFHQNFAVN